MKKIMFFLMFVLLISSVFGAIEQSNLNYDWSNNLFGVLPGGYSQVTVTLKNTGSATEKGVLELAHSSLPFAIVSAQGVCDPSFPNNVGRYYSLAPGESATVTLKADNFQSGGTYYPFLVHVNRCCTNGVDSFPCDAKEPFGWRYNLNDGKTISFNAPQSTSNDQCDTAFQAGEYLKTKGVYNCKTAVCENPSSSSSVAKCLEYGCISGEEQYDVCADGSSVVVRKCVSGSWELTNSKCSEKPIPPEPGINDFLQKYGLWIVAAILVSGGIVMLLRR